MTTAISLRTLLGHGQVDTARVCLGSLTRYSRSPFRLIVHDDGSLSQGDLDRLREVLGDFEVVPRSAADERMEVLLARHPAARAFRRTNPLALKVLDVALFESGSTLEFCDSDVLFLRPFDGLFGGRFSGAVVMGDVQNAYSVRSWQVALDRRLRLPRRVNTGILRFSTAAYDLDLIEWFLGRPEYLRTPVWVEQTAWALLAYRAGCRLLDERQVAFPERPVHVSPERVALHFINPRRDLLAAYLAVAPDRAAEAPVRIETVPAGRCGWATLAVAESRRRLARSGWGRLRLAG